MNQSRVIVLEGVKSNYFQRQEDIYGLERVRYEESGMNSWLLV